MAAPFLSTAIHPCANAKHHGNRRPGQQEYFVQDLRNGVH